MEDEEDETEILYSHIDDRVRQRQNPACLHQGHKIPKPRQRSGSRSSNNWAEEEVELVPEDNAKPPLINLDLCKVSKIPEYKNIDNITNAVKEEDNWIGIRITLQDIIK